MASWQELQAHVRAELAVEADGADELTLTVTLEEGRSQRVMLRRYAAWGREMVELRSAFGQQGEFDPVGLLEDNLKLPLGAVALHEGYLVLVHRMSLGDTTVEAVVFLTTRIGLLADALEGHRDTDRF